MSSVEYGVGAVFQLISLLILVLRFRTRVAERVGALFVLIAILYHGVGELLIWLIPGRNQYRTWIPEAAVSSFFLQVSAAILVFALVYSVFSDGSKPTDWNRLRRIDSLKFFHWAPLAAVYIGLMLLTLTGRGAAALQGYGESDVEVGGIQVLVIRFLLPVSVLLCVVLMVRFGRNGLLAGGLALVLSATITGQRNQLLIAGMLFLYLATTFGALRLKAKVVAIFVVLGSLGFTVLTAIRETAGRDVFARDSGAQGRVDGLISALGGIDELNLGETLLNTLGHRLDGNSFGAMVASSLNGGSETLGWNGVLVPLRLAIPSILYPGKADLPIWERVPKLYAQIHFGLPERDILQTQLGATFAVSGFAVFIGVVAIAAITLARLELKLLSSPNPAGVLFLLFTLNSVAQYGQGIEAWTTNLITAVFVVPTVYVVWKLLNSKTESSEQLPSQIS